MKRSFIGCIIPAKHLVDQYSYGPRKPRTADEASLLKVSQQLEVSRDDAKQIVEKINSYAQQGRPIPLTTEHLNIRNEIVRTGEVSSAWFEPDGSVSVQFSFDETKSSPGADAIKMFDSGLLQQLSLQHDLTTNEPYEVSLCAKGARTGSLITAELSNGVYKPVTHRVSVFASAGNQQGATVADRPIINHIIRFPSSSSSSSSPSSSESMAAAGAQAPTTMQQQQQQQNNDINHHMQAFAQAFKLAVENAPALGQGPGINVNAPSGSGFVNPNGFQQQQQQQQQQPQPQQPLDAKAPAAQPQFEKGESPQDVMQLIQRVISSQIPTKADREDLVRLVTKLFEEKHRADKFQSERFAQFGHVVQNLANNLIGANQKNFQAPVTEALAKGDANQLINAIQPVMVAASALVASSKRGAISNFQPATNAMQIEAPGAAAEYDTSSQFLLDNLRQAVLGRPAPPGMTQTGSTNFNFLPGPQPIYSPPAIYDPYNPQAPASAGVTISASAGAMQQRQYQQQQAGGAVDNAFTRNLDPELASYFNSNPAPPNLMIPGTAYSDATRKRFREDNDPKRIWDNNTNPTIGLQ